MKEKNPFSDKRLFLFTEQRPTEKKKGSDMSVLAKEGHFHIVYHIVNQVSSLELVSAHQPTPLENALSVHLRPSDSSGFSELITRKIRPFYSSSSFLSFPSTSSANITIKGGRAEQFYHLANQCAYMACFDRLDNVICSSRVNNRNYTALLHGIKQREKLFEDLQTNSVKYAVDTAFPPLKCSTSYMDDTGNVIICQNQLYLNSFAINTQRQTAESLQITTPQFLGPILEKAEVDFELNNLCCKWELELQRTLTSFEKCQLIIQLQRGAEPINLIPQDQSWQKTRWSVKRRKTNNPEFEELPDWCFTLPIAEAAHKLSTS